MPLVKVNLLKGRSAEEKDAIAAAIQAARHAPGGSIGDPSACAAWRVATTATATETTHPAPTAHAVSSRRIWRV